MHTQKKARLVHHIRVVAVLLTASLIFQTFFISGQGEAKVGSTDVPSMDYYPTSVKTNAPLTDKLKAWKNDQLKSNQSLLQKHGYNTKSFVDPKSLIPSNFTDRTGYPIASRMPFPLPKTNGQNIVLDTQKNPTVLFNDCLKRNNDPEGKNAVIKNNCILRPDTYNVNSTPAVPVPNGGSNTGTGATGATGANPAGGANPDTPVPATNQPTTTTKPTSTTTSSNWWANLGTWGQVGVGVGSVAVLFGAISLFGGKKSSPPTIVSAPPPDIAPTPPVTPPDIAPTPPVVTPPTDPLQPIKDLLAKLDEEKLDALRLTFSTTGGILLPTSPAAINLIRETDFKIIGFYNTNLLVIPPLTPTTIIEHDVNNDGRINQDDPKLIQDIQDKCILNQTTGPCRAFYDRTIKFIP